MVRAIVLKAPGTNNDYETNYALKDAGAISEIVHINEIACHQKSLNDYAILVIPGGFSYGDSLGAGKVYSLFLRYHLQDDINRFIKKGKIVLGVCNGFQVLVKSCILPGGDSQKITLAENDCGRFICKWVKLRVRKNLFWFKGLPEEIELPIAHAEGRFIASEEVLKDLKKKNRIALYYKENPNGSASDVAGITNNDGNVLGLMPHPERFLFDYQHPAYRNRDITAWGKRIYKNIVENA